MFLIFVEHSSVEWTGAGFPIFACAAFAFVETFSTKIAVPSTVPHLSPSLDGLSGLADENFGLVAERVARGLSTGVVCSNSARRFDGSESFTFLFLLPDGRFSSLTVRVFSLPLLQQCWFVQLGVRWGLSAGVVSFVTVFVFYAAGFAVGFCVVGEVCR